jgi:integrase
MPGPKGENSLIPRTESTAVGSRLEVEVAATAEFAKQRSRADNTVLAYYWAWRAFEAWCVERNLSPFPEIDPAYVAAFLKGEMDLGRTFSTINIRAAAIARKYRLEDFKSPTEDWRVKETLGAIRRRLGGTKPTRQAAALLRKDIELMLELWASGGVRGMRDQTVFMLGFPGAMRRSELVATDVEDVQETEEGLIITIPKSKANQAGDPEHVGIFRGNEKICPVRAFQEWLNLGAIEREAVIRRVSRWGTVGGRLAPGSVSAIIKHYVAAIGLDPTIYSGHSLRAGLITQAAQDGLAERDIMRQTRHKNLETLRRYMRKATLFEDNVSRVLWSQK